MKRRALIIYCDNTASGKLLGPSHDYSRYIEFLTSLLGGGWYKDEILGLHNPPEREIIITGRPFLNGADYTFTIFTGHGCIQKEGARGQQCIELSDKIVPITHLLSESKRQLLLIDACRGHVDITKGMTKIASALEGVNNFSIMTKITRRLFEKNVLSAEAGLTVLYSASEDESSLDTNNGAAYLSSLLDAAGQWNEKSTNCVLPINEAHLLAKALLKQNFGDKTIQQPTMNLEKRRKYFPFAVNPLRAISG